MAVDFNFDRPGYQIPAGDAVNFDGALGQVGLIGHASVSMTASQPELLMIPWEGHAVLAVAASGQLTDSNPIGEAAATVSITASAALAPSWYIRRPLVADIGAGWGQPQQLERNIAAPHIQAPPKQQETSAGWGELEQIEAAIDSGWAQIPTVDRHTACPHGDLVNHPQANIGCDYSHPASKNVEKHEIPWGDLDQITIDIGADYCHPDKKELDLTVPWAELDHISRELGLDYTSPPSKDVLKPIVSGPHWYPRWCEWHYPLPDGGNLVFDFTTEAYTAPAGDALIFDSADDAARIYTCYDGTWNGPKDAYWYQPHDWEIITPNIRSYYIIMNTVSLKRVSDNTPIPIMGMSVNADMDSWCWTLSANLRRKVDLDLVRPSQAGPVEVEANINGNTFRFIIESYGDDRQFGQQGFSISGRSKSAYLAAPYSMPASLMQPNQRTAAQLADEALLNSGFTVDWQLPDWLVPAGAYSVSQQTPMQQLLTIAAAAGGVVHSDLAANTINIVPWYQHMPWEWPAATVDAILPTFKSRRTNYQPQPQYTGVCTSGQAQGVMCLVKRSGTDGSDQPQMITDPLITATEAGLARGKRILADSGTRSIESITAPLLDDPGLLTPGMLIDVVDNGETWRGQVVSCTVGWSRPTVTQTIDVLRYYGS